MSEKTESVPVHGVVTWRDVLETLQSAKDRDLDSPAFVSCEPDDSDPIDGVRYYGCVEALQCDGSGIQAWFVGQRNTST